VNVEYWPFEGKMPRAVLPLSSGISPVPDVANFSWFEYGVRCGLPRIMRALDKRRIAASCSINAAVIDVYPSAATAIRSVGWEMIGHCYEQKILTLETEEDVIRQTINRISSFAGRSVTGWQGAGMVETVNTPEVLKAAGIRYVCDWGIDDLPCWMATAGGPLIAIPGNVAIDDAVVYPIQQHSSDELYKRLLDTLATFESELSPNVHVVPIALHPHVIGDPHRFPYLERMLDLLTERADTIFMTGTQIADWFATAEPFENA
jgi:peptidoglycan/xylan/chitin deacetylase (PgdA/CDA1 family)